MKKGKLEKIILYIVISVLFISLLTLIFFMNFSQVNLNINSDIWGPISTFTGALTGALISGSIAIYVMHRDISSRRGEKVKEINNNFKKSFELIDMWSNTYLQTLDSIHGFAKLKEGTKKNSMDIELNAMKECATRLEKINDDYIPQKVYKDFLDLKAIIDLTFHQYKAFISTIELLKSKDKLIVLNENNDLKKWILESNESIRKSFIGHLKVLQEYKSNLE
ncbi:hypothetical protein [Psychrobacillus sp. FSL K6-1415]|uniref:hypothetical protein n=1 Tax=Psychrobacillus sp. FSL K6-1415 TaxID=2921544 RepID=UPI0030F73B74